MMNRRSVLRLIVVLALLVCAAAGGIMFLAYRTKAGLVAYNGLELRLLLRRWREVGCPEGEKLIEFMRGRRSDLVRSNAVIALDGTDLTTVFAKLEIGVPGVMFITTNDVVILIEKRSAPRVILRPQR
jgi:hypothetical protein